MRYPIIFAAPLILASGAAQAETSRASIRLVLQVPVTCSIELRDVMITDGSIVANVHRRCNTSHSVTFSTPAKPLLGDLRVSYGAKTVVLKGNHAVLPQPERYYDGFDKLVIEASGGDQVSLTRFASSLRVGVDTV